MSKHTAPWSELDILRLILRQIDPMQHEYSCDNGHTLVPTKKGWECNHPSCSQFTQDWCHENDVKSPHSLVGVDSTTRIVMSSKNDQHIINIRYLAELSKHDSAVEEVLKRLSIYEPQIKILLV